MEAYAICKCSMVMWINKSLFFMKNVEERMRNPKNKEAICTKVLMIVWIVFYCETLHRTLNLLVQRK